MMGHIYKCVGFGQYSDGALGQGNLVLGVRSGAREVKWGVGVGL